MDDGLWGLKQMTKDWVSFKCREFYGIPRSVVVSWNVSLYLLECLFDERLGPGGNRVRVTGLAR